MEKEHLYSRDNYADHLIKVGKQSDSDLKTVFTFGGVKDILKPSVNNTGSILKPTQSVTLTKPVDANTPVILVPNVPGGLKVENPSPVNLKGTVEFSEAKKLPEKLTTTTLPTIQKELIAERVTANDNTKQASFTLPNMWIMIAMIIGVIVLMALSRKKK